MLENSNLFPCISLHFNAFFKQKLALATGNGITTLDALLFTEEQIGYILNQLEKQGESCFSG